MFFVEAACAAEGRLIGGIVVVVVVMVVDSFLATPVVVVLTTNFIVLLVVRALNMLDEVMVLGALVEELGTPKVEMDEFLLGDVFLSVSENLIKIASDKFTVFRLESIVLFTGKIPFVQVL